MREKWVLLLAASVASLALVATVLAGGWAVVTVRDLPEYGIAGKPLQLAFMVRAAGISPAGGLKPRVVAESGASVVNASAASVVETKKEGEYKATLVLPRPGNWTIRIDAFGDGDPSRWSGSTLPQLVVIAPGNPAPPALAQAALGERLFVAKGCTVCHISHEERVTRALDLQTLPGVLKEPGLDLFGKRFPESDLKRLLANPAVPRGGDSETVTWEMPNLELSQSEIAALIAFLNSDRPR